MIYLGLDPGASGGIAAIGDDRALLLAEPWPEGDRDILDLIRRAAGGGRCFAILERVSSAPGQGIAGAFSFGGHYRALRMALAAVPVSFEEVPPTVWQKPFGLPVLPKVPMLGKVATVEEVEAQKKARKERSAAQRDKKNALKTYAQKLFPSVKVTHAVADALLIAEWGRRNRA